MRQKVTKKATIAEIRAANPIWFSRDSKRFFNDIDYKIRTGASGRRYLVRSTYAFTDMFDGVKKLHYRINPIDSNVLKVLPLIDEIFHTKEEVDQWLKTERR